MPVNDKKRAYAKRLISYIQDYQAIFVVEADNVGSKQMQQIRLSLRGRAEVIFGKNTTMRRVLRDFLRENPNHPIENIVPWVAGNVGFIFTNGTLADIKDVILENKVPAPARVGAIAPCDVFVEPGPTGCDPGQTSWFQALNIATKINRGQIEIISRLMLVSEGEKVGNSEAALLEKLSIKPFTYGLKIAAVYDNGDIFDPQVLDLSESDLIAKLTTGIRALAAVGMEVGYPTKASIMHSVNYAFKALLSVGIGTDYKFDRVKPFEDFLANPGAFVTVTNNGPTVEEEKKVEESESEESAGGAGGLFDDEDDW